MTIKCLFEILSEARNDKYQFWKAFIYYSNKDKFKEKVKEALKLEKENYLVYDILSIEGQTITVKGNFTEKGIEKLKKKSKINCRKSAYSLKMEKVISMDSINKLQVLAIEIENLRKHMNCMIDKNFDLLDGKILRASQKLDLLLNEYVKLLGNISEIK